MELIYNLDEIDNAAKEFVFLTNNYKVWAFSGELGAGKTTFIKAVCRQLGVTEPVTSPTYAIIQQYYSGDKSVVYHIDMYRIKSVEEAIEAGVEECLLSNKVCLVECPEKGMLLFPAATVYASLQALSGSNRKLIVQLPQ